MFHHRPGCATSVHQIACLAGCYEDARRALGIAKQHQLADFERIARYWPAPRASTSSSPPRASKVASRPRSHTTTHEKEQPTVKTTPTYAQLRGKLATLERRIDGATNATGGLSKGDFAALVDHEVHVHGRSQEAAEAYVRENATSLAERWRLRSAIEPSEKVSEAVPHAPVQHVGQDPPALDRRASKAEKLLAGYARAAARLFNVPIGRALSWVSRMEPNLAREARGLPPLEPMIRRPGDLQPVLVDADPAAVEAMALIRRNVDPETGLDTFRDQAQVQPVVMK